MTTRNTYDRLLPSTLGFDRLFSILDNAYFDTGKDNSFPPINIIRNGDTNYTIEMAVAGYQEKDLEISCEKNKLKISGTKNGEENVNYIVHGIASRMFARSFVLADSVVVEDAILQDGILRVYLKNIIPEEQKTRRIAITHKT